MNGREWHDQQDSILCVSRAKPEPGAVVTTTKETSFGRNMNGCPLAFYTSSTILSGYKQPDFGQRSTAIFFQQILPESN